MQIQNKDIFIIDDKKPIDEESYKNRLIYTMKGMHTHATEEGQPILPNPDPGAIDNPDAFAYKYVSPTSQRYFIKMNSYGAFIDPLDKTHLRDVGKVRDSLPAWGWRQVNSGAFEEYLRYLKNQNPIHYHAAARTA